MFTTNTENCFIPQLSSSSSPPDYEETPCNRNMRASEGSDVGINCTRFASVESNYDSN